MSLEFRSKLVAIPHLIFTNSTQKEDLLDPTKTKTGLIVMLSRVLDLGFGFKVTAIKTDHHDDSALGPHSHFDGQALDGWPTNFTTGEYLDAEDLSIWIEDINDNQFIFEVGLAGSAYTQNNMELLGWLGFQDYGADHIHLGAIIL